jgi:hypothetical protein
MWRAIFIYALTAFFCTLGCDADPGDAETYASREVSPGVLQIGFIKHPRIKESSGVVASRQYPGVLWTHNDHNSRSPVLFGITREGKCLAEFRLVGADIIDWEDIAIDDTGHIYVGDIGNNDLKRTELVVYRVNEPDPKSPETKIKVKQTFRLRFPKKPFDCESLFVYREFGYVISKVFNDQPAEIYRFPLKRQKEPCVLERLVKLPINSPVTGADISADGQLLGIVSHSGAFVFRIDGDVAKASQVRPYHTKFRHEHIEACCFVPEGLLTTTESREIYLFTEEPFRSRAAD